jgi:flagellar protein FliO/FliZ
MAADIMDGESYLRFILALLLVLGLLALAAVLLRRSGLGPKLSRSRRLAVLESLQVGPKHRLLLIRRDDIEHLLLLGPQGDRVVETHISPSSTNPTTPAHDRSPQQPFADMLDDRATAVSSAAVTSHQSPPDESH